MTMEIHLKGALEPVVSSDPSNVCAMNISAAQNSGMTFFKIHDVNDHDVYIAINQVLKIVDIGGDE